MNPIELQIQTTVSFHPTTLIVSARVRYWEDAEVSGVSDKSGQLIPLRVGDAWCPKIDLETGRIKDWPSGTTADIHYKVCDAGEYWLEDVNGVRVKYADCYVPDKLLAHGDRGYGDYIIMKIGPDGQIEGWKCPKIQSDEWRFES